MARLVAFEAVSLGFNSRGGALQCKGSFAHGLNGIVLCASGSCSLVGFGCRQCADGVRQSARRACAAYISFLPCAYLQSRQAPQEVRLLDVASKQLLLAIMASAVSVQVKKEQAMNTMACEFSFKSRHTHRGSKPIGYGRR